MLAHLLFRGVFGLDCLAENLYNEIFKFRDYEFAKDMGEVGWLLEPLIPDYAQSLEWEYQNSFVQGLIIGGRYEFFWNWTNEERHWREAVGLLARCARKHDLAEFLKRAKEKGIDLVSNYMSDVYVGGDPEIVVMMKNYRTFPDLLEEDMFNLEGAAEGGHLEFVKEFYKPSYDQEVYEACVQKAVLHENVLAFFAEKGHYCVRARLYGAAEQNSPSLLRRYLEECEDLTGRDVKKCFDLSIACTFLNTGSATVEDMCEVLLILSKISRNPRADFGGCMYSFSFDHVLFDISRHPHLFEEYSRHYPLVESLRFLIRRHRLRMFKKYFEIFDSRIIPRSIKEWEKKRLIECALKANFPGAAEIVRASLQEEQR